MPRRRARLLRLAAAVALGALGWAGRARAQEEPSRPPPAAVAPPAPREPPGRYYVGADALWGSLSSRHPSIDGSSGAGLNLVMGWRFADGLAWDTRMGGFWTEVGPAPEINYPADKADYAFVLTGLVWETAGSGAPVSPWLGLWFGLHFVMWDTYFYEVSGLGASFGAGVQFRLPLGLVRLGAVLSLVDASSTYGEPAGGTTTALVSGGWLYDWGRP
jgi:hypothetical protein